MAAGVSTVRFWPFPATSGMDRSTAVFWPEPQLVTATPGTGPVVVRVTYQIAPADEGQFLAAMAKVRLSRLRTGGVRWGLFRDTEAAGAFLEYFTVGSWEEHLRQHNERLTGTDREYQERANALSQPPPVISHLVAAEMDLR